MQAVLPATPDAYDDEDEETAKKRHAFLVLWFAFATGTAIMRLEQINEALTSGSINLDAWTKHFEKDMASLNAEAHMIGRRLAGDTEGLTQRDITLGARAWAEQESYFEGFHADLRAGALSLEQIENRSRMYVKRTKGTVTEAFADSLASEDVVWKTGNSEHCIARAGFPFTCLDLAAGGPYPADKLPTTPGACKTPCMFECHCYIETVDGKFSTQGI